ncbi:MAG: hypothetical protein COB76_05705, partial [Alphaproteobacteria bacterium]
TMGVWMGNDDNSSMGRVFGGTTPAEMWRESIAFAHRGVGANSITAYDPEEHEGEFKSFLNGLFSNGGSGGPSRNFSFKSDEKPSHRLND